MKYFAFFFYTVFWNPMCILHLEHTSVRTRHISIISYLPYCVLFILKIHLPSLESAWAGFCFSQPSKATYNSKWMFISVLLISSLSMNYLVWYQTIFIRLCAIGDVWDYVCFMRWWGLTFVFLSYTPFDLMLHFVCKNTGTMLFFIRQFREFLLTMPFETIMKAVNIKLP